MSSEFINAALDPTPVAPEAGPSTGSWSQHHSGDAEGSFPNMDADADLERISCLESLCMNCHEQGVTRLLLTRIPYFRDIVVMSFACGHCHARSAEVQPANELAEKACRVSLRVDHANVAQSKSDLNRQVIKSETCAVFVPELEFEIPANGKRGDINTVEGVLTNCADSLAVEQANREIAEPEVAVKIQKVIDSFRAMAAGERSFTFILDDPAGNSFLENPEAPSVDVRVELKYYERTREQTLELGYAVEENKEELAALPVLKGDLARAKMAELFPNAGSASSSSSGKPARELTAAQGRGMTVAPHAMASIDTYFNVSDRSAMMQGACSACGAECETRMCVTDVPHFTDVVLLVTQCDECGYRDAEVKPMGRVSAMGRRVTLKVTSVDDLKRDLLKSDTASCEIPELELELLSGTLGGKYTTLEGMIEDIQTQLSTFNPFAMGDSSQPAQKGKMGAFLQRLHDLPSVKEPWTFILDDPLGNVFIFSPLGDADPNLKVERYERTFEQNEDLGLNDMNVDHYMDAEQEAELAAEIESEAKVAALEQSMAEAMGGPKAASAAESAAAAGAADAHRMVELKQSKIGGMINVEHDADQLGGASVSTSAPPVAAAAAASASFVSASAPGPR